MTLDMSIILNWILKEGVDCIQQTRGRVAVVNTMMNL